MRRPRFKETQAFYAAVGRRISEVRRGRLTQEVLAQKATLTRTSIINIEKGRQQILLHTFVDIARALGVAPVELLPVAGGVEELLRDAPKKGIEWVKSSVSEIERKES